MTHLTTLIQQMDTFLSQFRQVNMSYEQRMDNYNEMEKVICEFTSFVLDTKNEEIWEQIEYLHDEDLARRITELREQSALCVWAMEKYRAMELHKNKQDIDDYFSNIESCIETEFGSFEITSESKVLLIGAGAFPMTPLFIAKNTGAEVVGIDIDPEAIRLGRIVVSLLSHHSNITIEDCTVDQLKFTQEATHIVFASTIKEKFDILMQLHPLTNKDVVVAMRYGNGLKSLFNYPQQDVDRSLWNIENNIKNPGHVFDVILYKKTELGG